MGVPFLISRFLVCAAKKLARNGTEWHEMSGYGTKGCGRMRVR